MDRIFQSYNLTLLQQAKKKCWMQEREKELTFLSLLLRSIEYPASEKSTGEKAFYASEVRYRSIWHRVENPTPPREDRGTSVRSVTSTLIIFDRGFQPNIFPQTFYSQIQDIQRLLKCVRVL